MNGISASGRACQRLSEVTLLLTLVAACGCSSGPNIAAAVAKSNKSNCQRLANCYALYQQRNGFRGPATREEFYSFLASGQHDRNLELMGIVPADIDSVFSSGRDGQELVVRYGLNSGAMGPFHAVVLEQEGSDGVRLVAYTSSRVEEVSDDGRYEDILAGKTPPDGMGSPRG